MKTFRLFISLFLFLGPVGMYAQQLTQTLKGTVSDKESKVLLTGATIMVQIDSSNIQGEVTNENGAYKIGGIPLGRHKITCKYVGYKTVSLNGIVFSSAKEVVLNFELEEDIVLTKEVIVNARKNNGDPLNQMATVSSRSFTIEETDRYAGSRGDPSRMASNFAGVQGADDSRNDIIVRGNSPSGILWRMEGIDIPNPNHFAIAGTSGGPISLINNKYLSNSDFYTGAFPAEFGNGTAGVFDLRMRNGNQEKYEHSFQFGLFGTELFSEGPLSKKSKASYLINYRYSTLAVFGSLGINLGTTAVPKYQDAAIRFFFPIKKNASLSLWSIGGYSTIDIVVSKQSAEETDLYGLNDRDQYFRTWMTVVGANYKKSINKKLFFNLALASTMQVNRSVHEYIFFKYADSTKTVDKTDPMLRYRYFTDQKTANLFFNYKANSRLSIKYGILNSLMSFNFSDSAKTVNHPNGVDSLGNWMVRWDTKEKAVLSQGFVQAKYRINSKFTINAGLHSQYFSLSNSLSLLEPRAGLRYELSKNQSLSFGTGIYSQMQQSYLYFYRLPGNTKPHNDKMDFSKSLHFVLAYDLMLKKSLRFKVETYYQSLYNVPVAIKKNSYSLMNTGVGFSRFFPDSLTNKGTGYNYGFETTLEKYFESKYYFMINVSLYQSKYKGSDNVLRNTDFNGRYAVNALFSKDFDFFKKQTLQIGAKLTTAGGKFYSPADTIQSNRQSEVIGIDSLRNTLKFPAYFRFDIRISYKWNRPKVTHELAIDLINVLNTQNVLKLTYVPSADGNNIRQEYQLGRLPVFYYKLDF